MKNTKKNTWALRNKVTGQIYPNFTYKTRASARKAAKAARFGGMFTPVQVNVAKTYQITPAKAATPAKVTGYKTTTSVTMNLTTSRFKRSSFGKSTFRRGR